MHNTRRCSSAQLYTFNRLSSLRLKNQNVSDLFFRVNVTGKFGLIVHEFDLSFVSIMDPSLLINADLMYHKLTYGDVLWAASLCASLLGIALNALLIVAIHKTGRRLVYSRLFLVAAIFDLFFSVVELLTQHQIAVKNGVMFLLPRGIEWWFKNGAFGINYVIFIIHCFAYMQGIFILAALFRYRFILAKEPHALPSKYLDGLVVSTIGAIVCSLSAAIGVYQASKKGWNYYENVLKRSNVSTKFFMYVVDIRDFGTIGYFFGGLLLSTVSFVIVLLYARQAFIQPKDEDAKTRVHQAQMTQALVFRTLTTLVFGVWPVVFRFDAEIFGTGMMFTWPWTAVLNAVVTLFIIPPYRRYVLNSIGANIENADVNVASPSLLSQLSKM
ncbi:hypothetical protein M3Y96_00188900 [Aphelenchoides besseyi]|nr:hypothetical protein M3Y96_00188900 [Aphelenchoides besseyi]